MTSNLLGLALLNARKTSKTLVLCVFGIALGVGMFVFFLSLGTGIQEGVLNRLYPIQQIEFESKTVSVLGLEQTQGDGGVSQYTLDALAQVDGVVGISPKMRSHFPARLFGGEEIFGSTLRAEAFLDGLAVEQGRDGMSVGVPAEFADRGEVNHCADSSDCGEEGQCLDGLCFYSTCATDQACTQGRHCRRSSCSVDSECDLEGGVKCIDGRCSVGVCVERCSVGAGDCALQETCVPGLCDSEEDCPGGACVDGECASGVCEPLPCYLRSVKHQLRNDTMSRGEVELGCDDERCEEGDPCPSGTYCIPESVRSKTGYCEPPIPVLLSPVIVELFNAVAAPAMGLQPIRSEEDFLGLTFQVQLGSSFLSKGRARSKQITKKAEVVGVSHKAVELGLTVPLPYLKRANGRIGESSRTTTYDAVLVEVEDTAQVEQTIFAADGLGLQVAPRSREGRRAGKLLFLFTLCLVGVSVLILIVASLHVSRTFHMIVSRRMREFGILRSLGATAAELWLLVVLEALFAGSLGAFLGIGVAWASGELLEMILLGLQSGVTFRPSDFFSMNAITGLLGWFVGVLFTLAGALAPGARASRLDPAEITRG